jgi:hypothetical protein
MVKNATRLYVPQGHVVYDVGDVDSKCYVVLGGEVQRVSDSSDGKEEVCMHVCMRVCMYYIYIYIYIKGV